MNIARINRIKHHLKTLATIIKLLTNELDALYLDVESNEENSDTT